MAVHDPTRLAGIGEIAENEAIGEVSLAYEQLRSILGVPFVPTIYRMIAVHESVLVKALGRLGSVLSVQRERGFVHEVERLARQSLKIPSEDSSGGGEDSTGRPDSTSSLLIDRYSRANPLNLLFVLGLLGNKAVEWPSVMSPPLPLRSRDTFSDILVCHGGLTIPGFWRELGQRPELLEPMWSATRAKAEHGGFDVARKAVIEFGVGTIRGAKVGNLLGDLSVEDAEQIHQLVKWFPTGIATMIVETEWLKVQTWPNTSSRDDRLGT